MSRMLKSLSSSIVGVTRRYMFDPPEPESEPESDVRRWLTISLGPLSLQQNGNDSNMYYWLDFSSTLHLLFTDTRNWVLILIEGILHPDLFVAGVWCEVLL